MYINQERKPECKNKADKNTSKNPIIYSDDRSIIDLIYSILVT